MVTGQTASTTGAHRRSHKISCCFLHRSTPAGLKYCQTGIKGRGALWTLCASWCVRMRVLALFDSVSRRSWTWRGDRVLPILLPRSFFMRVIASGFRTIRQDSKRFLISSAQRGPDTVTVMINQYGWLRGCYRWASRRALWSRVMVSSGITFLSNITIGRHGHGLPLIQRLMAIPEW